VRANCKVCVRINLYFGGVIRYFGESSVGGQPLMAIIGISKRSVPLGVKREADLFCRRLTDIPPQEYL
jgi:hypothetical protein